MIYFYVNHLMNMGLVIKMKKENKIDELIYEIEDKMKHNKIQKQDLYVILNRNTVGKIFSHHEGIDTLRKIINFVDNVTYKKK